MNQISNLGRYYLAFCVATCGYFSAAAINAWPAPNFAAVGRGASGHIYSSGFYGGRSSGGFGGGGK